MNRAEVILHIKKVYHISPDCPWERDIESIVFRHQDTKKWFALLMPVNKLKLGLDDDTYIDVVTLKCEPLLIDSLVLKDGFHRAYHMNKTMWLTIRLDGSVNESEIKNLIHLSFQLTKK